MPGVSERRGGALTGGPQSADGRLNAAQGFTGRRTYDAFGAVVSTTGTWPAPDGWGAPSGYREDGSPFRLVGHRLYDPAVGRFLSRDPARDGANWYAYCGNDPVGESDPEGLQDGKLKIRIAVPIVHMVVTGISNGINAGSGMPFITPEDKIPGRSKSAPKPSFAPPYEKGSGGAGNGPKPPPRPGADGTVRMSVKDFAKAALEIILKRAGGITLAPFWFAPIPRDSSEIMA